MARPDLHRGPGDGIPRMVDYSSAHVGALPLGERRVDDLYRDDQVPQHGRLGFGDGGGKCGGRGHGGRRGAHPQSRRIHGRVRLGRR